MYDRILNFKLVPVIIGLFCIGCSSQTTPIEDESYAFTIATRQLPPEPSFAMTRWVRPAQVLPPRETPVVVSKQSIKPIVRYTVDQASLKEAALVLSALTRYRSYCSSIISDTKLTLDTIGTLDEIATEIENLAEIKVVIDHSNKEVRFLARDGFEAELNTTGI